MGYKDLTGKKFARLTVISRADDLTTSKGKRVIRWNCKCDCGNMAVVYGAKLRSGHTKSCGCYMREQSKKANKTHGMADTKIYYEWGAMRERCSKPSNMAYSNYGGRGIKVCQEWENDFSAYYNYVSKLPHFGEEGYSLDRIDNDKGYEPGNVRWATRKEQANNRRTNHLLTYNGETHTITEWAEKYNLSQSLVNDRLNRYGWSIEKALTQPVRKQKKRQKGGIDNDDKCGVCN